jgi:hypothetical protein
MSILIRIFFFVAFTTVITLSVDKRATADDKSEIKNLNQIIGEIIFEYDLEYREWGDVYAFGSGPAAGEFSEYYYEYVVRMSQPERFSYFWFGLWHLNLQGGEMGLLAKLVMEDAGAEDFVEELREFIKKGADGGRQEWRTDYARGLLHLLGH